MWTLQVNQWHAQLQCLSSSNKFMCYNNFHLIMIWAKISAGVNRKIPALAPLWRSYEGVVLSPPKKKYTLIQLFEAWLVKSKAIYFHITNTNKKNTPLIILINKQFKKYHKYPSWVTPVNVLFDFRSHSSFSLTQHCLVHP